MEITKSVLNTISYYHLFYFIFGIVLIYNSSDEHYCNDIYSVIIFALFVSFTGAIVSNYNFVSYLKSYTPLLVWMMVNIFFLGMYISCFINIDTECKKMMTQYNNDIWMFFHITTYIFITEFILIFVFMFLGCMMQVIQYFTFKLLKSTENQANLI